MIKTIKEYLLEWWDDVILNLKVVKENVNGSYQKGYEDGSQSLDVNQKNDEMLYLIRRIEDLKREERELDKKLVDSAVDKKIANLLTVIDYNHIVRLEKKGNGGILYLGDERADDGTMANLKSEALFLTESRLWKLLYETPKELAEKAMFKIGTGLEDMQKGRSILYTLDTQKNIIDLLKNVK